MPSWKDFVEQLGVIQAAPVPFFVAVLAVFGLVWTAVSWSYSTILSSKNSQIELLDRQVADYKDKLSGATPTEAKAKIDDLEARLARIEPRRLSAEQRRVMASLVEVPAGSEYHLSIQSEMSCPDCNQYAADFYTVLDEAHWKIISPRVMGAAAASPKGIAILTPDTNSPLPEAAALARALSAAKIPFDLKSGADINRSISVAGPPMAVILITARGIL
jgi:hypothetical protein